jgi:hypothetical protein
LYKTTFQITDSEYTQVFYWLLKKITHNCRVKNTKQKYRIRYDFTYAQKQNPNEATEAADNLFPKTFTLALDTAVPHRG